MKKKTVRGIKRKEKGEIIQGVNHLPFFKKITRHKIEKKM
jgi:hypothetical protein